MKRLSFVDGVWRDIVFGCRMLVKSRGFTLTVVLTLGLAIGLNCAIFSAVHGILLRQPPLPSANRIFAVTTSNLAKNLDGYPVSPREFSALRLEDNVFEDLAAASYDDLAISGRGEPERVSVGHVTPNYFEFLGMSPLIGRTFEAAQDISKQQFRVVISYDLWREKFSEDPKVVGTTIDIADESYTVVGVMPLNFKYAAVPAALWIPKSFSSESISLAQSKNRTLTLLARLRAGVSQSRAEAESGVTFKRLREDDHDDSLNRAWVPRLIALREFLVGPNVRRVLFLLMFVVAFVLLIACANVAGISLARSVARQHEYGVRAALGAARSTLIQQAMIESVLLAALSAGVGILVALWGVMFLRSRLQFSPSAAWLAGKLEINNSVLLFGLLICGGAVLIFGLTPGLQTSKPNLQTIMKESGRTGTPAMVVGLQRGIVIGEIAIAMLLMFSTAAVIQIIIAEVTPRLGFDPQQVLTVSLTLSGSKYVDSVQQALFFDNAGEGLRALPAVQFVAATQALPESHPARVPVEVQGQLSLKPEERPGVARYIISPAYFSVMRIPILRGRAFSANDRGGAPAVAVVNETFAKRFQFKGDPVGARILVYENGSSIADSREVVGVVGDVIDYVGQDHSVPQIYVPFLQEPVSTMTLVLRTSNEPSSLEMASRNVIRGLDKGQPIESIRTMTQVLERKGASDRLVGGLLGAFTAVALCLATIGVYGVISFMVVQRISEIGLRIALGAQRSNIARLILSGAFRLACIGIASGVLIAALASRFVSFIRPDVSVRGLLFLSMAPVILIVTSLLASCLPARRAMRLDPNAALRYE